MNISFQYASSIWSIIIWVPPILKFNRKPFSKAGSYSQQSNRLKIVFLTVGPLLIQSVESNGFHLDPQTCHLDQIRWIVHRRCPRIPDWAKRRKTKICPELSISIFENLNLGFPVFDVSRDLKGRIRIGLYRCFLNWNPCRSDKPINTLIKYTGHHKPFLNLKNLRVL